MNELSDSKEFSDSGLRSYFSKAPLSFVDIGARDGIHELISPVANICHVTAYEPDHDSVSKIIEDKSNTIYAALCINQLGLAGESGSRILNLLSAPTNHSLLEPNPRFTSRYAMTKWDVVGQTRILTSTLDYDDSQSSCPHFGEIIKLDTQGSEYEILEGGRGVLAKNTIAVFCEVAFCQLYRSQKLFSEVELLLRDQGFSFYGFSRIHSRSKKNLDKRRHWLLERQIYADAVFLKDPFDNNNGSETFSNRKAKSLFTASMLLGYYDLSLELLGHESMALNHSQRSALNNLILRYSKLDIETITQDVSNLVDELATDPTRTIMRLGKFLDSKRAWPNFDDF